MSTTHVDVHLVWTPKNKKRILVGEVALRAREILRQVAAEHEMTIISGKIAPDHVHMCINYRADMPISKIVQYLKGVSAHKLKQEFIQFREGGEGPFWERGYLTINVDYVVNQTIQQYLRRYRVVAK